MKKLSKKIIEELSSKIEVKPKNIANWIYRNAKNYPGLTKNALAQLYARKKETSVFRFLDEEDKKSLTNINTKTVVLKKQPTSPSKSIRKKIQVILDYDTDDVFKKKHINEINLTYTYHCYTATFVLTRKVIENLIIDILREKFPKENDLYFDRNKSRFKNFEDILKNIYRKRSLFGAEVKAVERLNQLCQPLRKDANDKTHSWFHIASKKEIDQLRIDEIIALIMALERHVSLRLE